MKLAVFLTMVFCTSAWMTEAARAKTIIDNEMNKNEENQRKGTIMLIVKAKTTLSEAEFLKVAEERKPQFVAIPGLIQKYYIKTGNPGEYGGVYIWDSMESLKKYRESELAASIAAAYKTTGQPGTEVVEILFELRD